MHGKSEQPRRAYSIYAVPSDEWVYISVPAIVSEELFGAVQEQLAENRKRSRASKGGARHLLQGLLVCKRCGYAYCARSISRRAAQARKCRYAYYRCTGTDAHRFGGQRICESKPVRTDMLETAVWKDVCLLLSDPERIEREYRRRLTEKKGSAGWSGLEQLRARIQKVKRGMARLIDAYADGLLEKSEFEPRIKGAKDRLSNLEAEAKACSEENNQRQELKLVIGRLQDFAGRVNESLKEADWETRREIISTLVKQVEVDNKEVRVVYRITPSPFSLEGPRENVYKIA